MPVNKSILALLQQHDPKSQQELYDLYKAKIMGLCRRYSKKKEEAEDVFQEAFIRIFQNIDQLDDLEHLEQWMNRIAVNAAINYYHRHKRHLHEAEHNGCNHQNEEYKLILSQFSDEMLIAMINDLADGYRIVFNMYLVEGYTHAEIADMLHISEVTSRSQLNRAKHILKTKLKAFGIIKYEEYG